MSTEHRPSNRFCIDMGYVEYESSVGEFAVCFSILPQLHRNPEQVNRMTHRVLNPEP